MIKLPIKDSRGSELLLTADIRNLYFDAVTCSPRTDGGFGFSMSIFVSISHISNRNLKKLVMPHKLEMRCVYYLKRHLQNGVYS